jgi:hypothetical protein
MPTTYDVRIWGIDVYRGKTSTAYTVMWRVGTRRWKKRFKTEALADSHRSELVSAARGGEAFDVGTGRPVSAARPSQAVNWLDFACEYIDMKWPTAAATYRLGISEALTAATVAMLDGDRGRPDAALLRSALHRWAFNTGRRDDPDRPAEIRDALAWARRNSLTVQSLADPAVLRRVLGASGHRGEPASTGALQRGGVHR